MRLLIPLAIVLAVAAIGTEGLFWSWPIRTTTKKPTTTTRRTTTTTTTTTTQAPSSSNDVQQVISEYPELQEQEDEIVNGETPPGVMDKLETVVKDLPPEVQDMIQKVYTYLQTMAAGQKPDPEFSLNVQTPP